MARCLVIGGNGFLGSHVVDALAADGHEVSVFDRFGFPVQFTAQAAAIVGDFLDREALAAALAGQEHVFHFLSSTTPASAEDDPTTDVRTNLAGSVDLFTLAADAGVARLYFASTGGSIYGDQAVESFSEDVTPLPVSPYAIGKLAIEGYLRYFGVKRGLESVSFRISNPYGPRQHAHRKQGVIPIFLQRIAEGRPITVFGDGSMVRDYVFVEDVAAMVVATAGRSPQHPVYNVGSGTGTTIAELLELARSVTGREFEVAYEPQPVTFVNRSVLDVSRFVGEFCVRPTVSLREGMESTWRDTLRQVGDA